ncbi:AI-2E family transporter [Caldibacillus lycopersici]|uniref:AI-2E family transporter n=1 Tax=Perspicuibacillus lycopersici TaxID=1325689 RepID=A0AAE3ISV3_9BACI|nr:AI-2E family transporter [Perspicuibacillus lycopersici]MCU9613970.1 AI-2E family transporter [Perspicuibacillus lycopersici]
MDIKVKWFYRLGFLLLLFVVIFIFLKLKPFWHPILHVVLTTLFPFVVAAFIAYLLRPLVEKLHRNGLQKWLSVLIIYILFFVGFGFAIYKGIPIFVHQLKDLSENVPGLMKQYDKWAIFVEEKTKNWPFGLQGQIDKGMHAVNNGIEHLVERILNIIFWVLDKFFLLLLIPFIAFYMLKDSNYLYQVFWKMIPGKWRSEMQLFILKVDESLGNYIRGQLIVCGTIGTVSACLFWLIKLKYPLLLGSIVGATNVIPYFGPIIGAIPAVIIAATISNKLVIYVVLIIFVLQFLESNVLSPFIVGKSLRMHPLLIMFSILIGGEICGITGLILAVPVVAIIKTGIIQGHQLFVKKQTLEENGNNTS